MIIQSVAQISSVYRPRYLIILEVLIANYLYYLKTKRINVEIIIVTIVLQITYVVSKLLQWYYRTEIILPKELQTLKKGRHIIVANHRCAIDPFLILVSLPHQTYQRILPIRLFTANIFLEHLWQRFLMMPFGCFRAYAKKSKLSGVKGGLKLSDLGQSLFIFPEGKRVKPTSKVEPKVGIAYLVQKRDFTIIPVNIEYVKSTFPKKTRIHWGKPFFVNDAMRSEDLNTITKYIFNKVEVLSLKK